jgi:hypothetical protein
MLLLYWRILRASTTPASSSHRVVTHSPPLEPALDLWPKAAETETPHDVNAATDQTGTVLRLWKTATCSRCTGLPMTLGKKMRANGVHSFAVTSPACNRSVW